MTDLTPYLDEVKAKILEQRKNREELDRLRVENEELKQLIRETVRGSDALKPIDWSQVADCVPVKVWEDFCGDPLTVYRGAHALSQLHQWNYRSLITGIDIAWSGGGCPLPDGVEYVATLRDGRRHNTAARWHHREEFPEGDIISFRVTGIADGWTEEVGK